MISAQALSEHFGLEALPVEGGLFRQTYRSDDTLAPGGLPGGLPDRYPTPRPAATAILFLLTADPDSFSALHRLPTDEVYHFYLGDPVEMLQLYPDGRSERVILGPDVLAGQHVQYVAPRDVWQGSRLLPGGRFALLGTTMAPGFVPGDYDGGDREALVRAYPQTAGVIRQLTRPAAPLAMPPQP